MEQCKLLHYSLYRVSCKQLGKGKAMDESRGEFKQRRAVHPTELFVITTPKMLHCMDWDCRCFPYLSCKALLIWQHYNRLFLLRFAFPSERILDQQTQFT